MKQVHSIVVLLFTIYDSMLSLDTRISMSFEEVNRWLSEFETNDDVLHRSARHYYTDVGDSGNHFTGIVSDEVERGGKMTEDHIRAPQSMFKLRYKYDRESLTNFEKFTENFILDRYTIGITPKQNVEVKHKVGGTLPESMVYSTLTNWWWTRRGTVTLERTKEFPLFHIFPKWYLQLVHK